MSLVGSYVGLSKLLVAVFPVFLLAWLRFGIAAIAMARWLRPAIGSVPLSARERLLIFLESFFGNFLFSICMLFGVALTSALAAGVAMATIPAAVALLSRWFLGERMARRTVLAIVLSMAGIALLAFARDPGSATAGPASGSAFMRALGYGLLLGAAFCEATYVVIGKRLAGRVTPKRISATINLWGLALMSPFGLWQAARFDFAAVEPFVWLLLVFYAMAASVWAVWLWMRGLTHVPASRAGVFCVMLPVTAAAVGVGWLGEQLTFLHGAALVLAVAGLLLATWPGRSRQAALQVPI
jgi:drug/metabolite transporter (DMT)-like permease